MYCQNCGQLNDDNAYKCVKCTALMHPLPEPAPRPVPPPNYLIYSILSLLFFWPTGIAAVIYASQVDTKATVGDMRGALESSRKARFWCWVTVCVWGVLFVLGMLYVLFFVFILSTAATLHH